MKKSFPVRGLALAALLACAGAAQAQSSVQLYGLVDMSAGRFQDPGVASRSGVENGSMTTSYWGLRGKEDLGSGLSAVFALEAFFRADTGAQGRFNGDTFFARNSYVGLSSDQLGTVTLGRNTTLLFVSTIVFNAFGDSYGFSPSVRHVFLPNALTAPVTGDSGWNDSVLYTTPSFGGLKGSVLYAASEKVGGRNVSAGLSYGTGPFAATAVFQDAKKDISTALAVNDTRTWQVGASYDFGVVKLFAQHTQAENRSLAGEPKSKLTDISAAIPVGNGKILAAYGLLNRPDTDNDRKTFSLGYDHFLSKRTDVYAVAMRDKDEAVATRQSATSVAVGIRHRF
jgi:predicted porin